METNHNENELQKNQGPVENMGPTADAENGESAGVETTAPVSNGEEPAQKAVAEETPENPRPQNQEPRKGKKAFFRSSRFKRGGMATLMSVVFIAIVVVVNILVGVLTQRFPSMDIDMTAQKLNSLSDQALEIAGQVDQDTVIYLIGNEDSYRQNRIYSVYTSYYGVTLQSSQISALADRLQEKNSKISVKYIDPDTNPKFISDYADENLQSGMVMVETEARRKVLSPSDMFSMQQSSSGSGYDVYSKVDTALAGALEMVNLDNVPVLTLATGHGELLSSSSLAGFKALMEGKNFEIKEIDFLTEEIPEDTQVLMLPTPTTDYTEEELQKVREYLDDENRPQDATLLVTCDPSQAKMPNLAGFLEEWGVRVEEGYVAETDQSRMALRSEAFVLVDAEEELMEGKTYNTLINPRSSPLTLLFNGNGGVSTKALWTTADTAYVSTGENAEAQASQTAQQTVATVSAKYVSKENYRRSVLVFGSSYIFTDTFMNTSAFDDRSYISDMLQFVTGTDDALVTVAEEQVQTNTVDVTASASTVNMLGLGVFTVGLPVVILILGLGVFLKRRHL